jgi:muramidase (phage lysozyme)
MMEGRAMSFRFVPLLVATTCLTLAGCATEAEDDLVENEASAFEREVPTLEVCHDGVTVRVISPYLNVRETAGGRDRIRAVLAIGDLATCVGTSGDRGWVHVRTQAGVEGWAYGRFLVRHIEKGDLPEGDDVSETFATCAPERAHDVVGDYQKAFHDLVAYAEGTAGRSKDGYDVAFGYRIMRTCASHPNQCTNYGGTCSTASGRYQFLTTTWNMAARARDLRSFEPDNQERAAAFLIGNIRRVTIPQDRALTAAEFSNALSRLSYEWASLPPNRYGQPTRSVSELRRVYCQRVRC